MHHPSPFHVVQMNLVPFFLHVSCLHSCSNSLSFLSETCSDHDAMSQEQIKGLVQFVPSTEEKHNLYEYLSYGHGNFDNLCECEKFMVTISKVRHAKRKLDAVLFMQNFGTCLEDLRQDARLVQKSCDEISTSPKLRKILGIVLRIGNQLNTAGPGDRREANAFTVESLSKLGRAKAFDKRTTFLQYLVGVLKKNNAYCLLLKDDMPSVFKAEKVVWEHLVSEMEKLEKDLNQVRKIALYTAPDTADDNQTLQSSILSTTREVEVLQESAVGRFTLDACLRMGSLIKEVGRAKEQYEQLLCYFGEDGENEMQPDELFGTLSTFCRELDAALEEVSAREKARMREARAMSRVKPLPAGAGAGIRTLSRPLPPVNTFRTPPTKRHSLSLATQPASVSSPNHAGIFQELKAVSKGFRWRKKRGKSGHGSKGQF